MNHIKAMKMIEALRLKYSDVIYDVRPGLANEFENDLIGLRNLSEAPQPAQQKPTSIRERWNIERDGADLLVCFNQHDKGEKCEYQRFVPAPRPAQQPLTEEQIQDILQCGNPTQQEIELVRLGWNAAHGIGGKP